jgi:hypothetical protein
MVVRELVEAIREESWQVSTTSIDSWGRGSAAATLTATSRCTTSRSRPDSPGRP